MCGWSHVVFLCGASGGLSVFFLLPGVVLQGRVAQQDEMAVTSVGNYMSPKCRGARRDFCMSRRIVLVQDEILRSAACVFTLFLFFSTQGRDAGYHAYKPKNQNALFLGSRRSLRRVARTAAGRHTRQPDIGRLGRVRRRLHHPLHICKQRRRRLQKPRVDDPGKSDRQSRALRKKICS